MKLLTTSVFTVLQHATWNIVFFCIHVLVQNWTRLQWNLILATVKEKSEKPKPKNMTVFYFPKLLLFKLKLASGFLSSNRNCRKKSQSLVMSGSSPVLTFRNA